MRGLLVLGLTVAALGGAVHAAGVPAGPYQDSCSGMRIEGGALIAECLDRDGRRKSTWLIGYEHCDTEIFNDNGVLKCRGWEARAAARPDAAGDDLPVAEPAAPAPARKDEPDSAPAAVPAVVPAVAADLPDGSWREACVDARIDGDTLRARCRGETGRLRTTYLTGYRFCTTQIIVVNGLLDCEGRVGTAAPAQPAAPAAGPSDSAPSAPAKPAAAPAPAPQPARTETVRDSLPAGPWQARCTHARVEGDTLLARCTTAQGRVRHASLKGFAFCTSEIMVRDDGLLDCRAPVTAAAAEPAKPVPAKPVAKPAPAAPAPAAAPAVPAAAPAAATAAASGLPAGDWSRSCRNWRLVDGVLTAECRANSGGWHFTWVRLDGCAAASNVDGRLTCSRR